MKHYPLATRLLYKAEDVWYIFVQELHSIFHDKGVLIIFFLAGLVYPILYPLLYDKEVIIDMPIAIVDDSQTQHSREYIRKLDATREVKVAYKCLNMKEAEDLYHRRKVHGVVYFPNDFETQLQTLHGQTYVSIYCDMSSFLYYKNMQIANNFVMLDEHHGIQLRRYEMTGKTGETAELLTQPLKYEEAFLYNIGGGFASFLLPAILILILHQTLFFGVGMLAGTARERNGELFYIEGRKEERSTLRIVLGKGFAYFIIYFALAAYTLGLIPRLFNLPHIGTFADVMKFMVPFLLAATFFAITVSVFVRERETGLITMVFFTVILLFLAGFSWPASNVPVFWHYIAQLFPTTFGINGYIHINSMGATLAETRHEYMALWIQAGAYFLSACLSLRLSSCIHSRLQRKATA